MKNIILAITIGYASLLTSAIAHNNNGYVMTPGMKVFKKKLRRGCRSTGIKFSRVHTRKEWQDINNGNNLKKEAVYICPRLKIDKINQKDWENLFDFLVENSKDNPHRIKC